MAKIDAFFKLMHDQGASDLHLNAGQPPALRIDGQVERVSLQLPPDYPLVLDRVGRYGRQQSTLHVRIADLAASLAPLAPVTPGATTLAVRDEFC
ncbi:MAG: hypothetical protein M0Z56_10920, partial [Desulfobacteraceae bacterium]|nr:hypothetical protein [Desulfobacteraceae bacterium]